MKPSPFPLTPVTASCRPDEMGGTARIEPGASAGSGSHRHSITVTARQATDSGRHHVVAHHNGTAFLAGAPPQGIDGHAQHRTAPRSSQALV
jgi:hypothetical protein